ncbi:hypothetical protein [Cohnella pontilimi]|uniref:hypothetical protein n=1 Tax=Cohnella pontilimi TaxID=2564100 RepID=UPI00319EAE88
MLGADEADGVGFAAFVSVEADADADALGAGCEAVAEGVAEAEAAGEAEGLDGWAAGEFWEPQPVNAISKVAAHAVVVQREAERRRVMVVLNLRKFEKI